MMMLDLLLPVSVISILFGGTALLTRIITDHRFRNKIVNAGKLDLDPELIKSFVAKREPSKLEALKWGLIGFSAGIGLIVIHFAEFELNSPLPFGIELTAIAGGFLAYFFIARNMND